MGLLAVLVLNAGGGTGRSGAGPVAFPAGPGSPPVLANEISPAKGALSHATGAGTAAQGPTSAYLEHEHESPQVRLRSGDGMRGGYSSGVGWLAFASWDSSFYVAAPPSSVDQIVADSFYDVQTVIPVGSNPFGVAVDPANKEVFVTSMGSDNVSIINGTSQLPVGSVTVQSSPEGIAFDPTDDALFVADNGTDNVTVISVATLSVVANVSVGTTPAGVAWDNASDRVFVTNRASDNVSVISGGTDRVLGSVPVGSDPFGIADDNTTGRLYVADEGSKNVSVIAADPASLYATIPVATQWGGFYPPQLEDVAYDSIHQMVWVTAGLTVVVLDAQTDSAVDEVAFDPSGIAFDPQNDTICETNSVNTSSGCFVYGGSGPYGSLNRDPVVTFQEQGLPTGVGWNVTLGSDGSAVTQDAATGSISFGVDAGTIAEEGCPCGYSYPYVASSEVIGAAPQTIVGNVTNDSRGSENETVPVSFTTQGEYPVSFQESGLPPSIDWGVTLAGTFDWTATGSPVTFGAANGSYNFTLRTLAGYRPIPGFGSVTVNGSGAQVNVSWVAPALYGLVFNESGLPAGTNWSVDLDGAWNASTNATIRFALPNGTYDFSVGGVDGFLSNPRTGSVTVDGSALAVAVEFVHEPAYEVFFTETGLPVGTTWSVYLSGAVESDVVQSRVPSSLSFAEPNGRYTYRIPAVAGYTADPSSGSLSLNGTALLVQIGFTPLPVPIFDVYFAESGLPGGTNWSVTLGSATLVSPTETIEFSEPNGTYPFVVNSPAGFAASPGSGSIAVNGSEVPLQAIAFGAISIGLSANFSYEIQYASCRSDGGFTNFVVLAALAAGGSPPYAYNWTLPTGTATTALTSATTTFGQGNTVTLTVSDSARRTATHSAVLPMVFPTCTIPAPKPISSIPLSLDQWAILGLAIALVAVTGAAVWLGIGGRGGGQAR